MILQTTHKLTRYCNITEYDFANKSMSFVLELILSVVCLSLLNKQKKVICKNEISSWAYYFIGRFIKQWENSR